MDPESVGVGDSDALAVADMMLAVDDIEDSVWPSAITARDKFPPGGQLID